MFLSFIILKREVHHVHAQAFDHEVCIFDIHCFLETHRNDQNPAVVNYHRFSNYKPTTAGVFFLSFPCISRKQWM